MRSVEEGIEDVRKMKELGLRGVMLPGNPQVADYDDPIYDPFWEADGRHGYAAQLPHPDQQAG